MAITQLNPGAIPGQRYGSFAGKPPSGSTPITQLSPLGVPSRRYGSFAGRVGASFPTQIPGLRAYYSGGVKELCLVAVADAPSGMGGVVKIKKGGTTYAIYLVETTDPNASLVRIKTSTGVKSCRLLV